MHSSFCPVYTIELSTTQKSRSSSLCQSSIQPHIHSPFDHPAAFSRDLDDSRYRLQRTVTAKGSDSNLDKFSANQYRVSFLLPIGKSTLQCIRARTFFVALSAVGKSILTTGRWPRKDLRKVAIGASHIPLWGSVQLDSSHSLLSVCRSIDPANLLLLDPLPSQTDCFTSLFTPSSYIPQSRQHDF